MSRTVAVIGAGLGGMAAAGRLAAKGYRVDVYERQGFAGGKAGSIRIGEYRFDTGPSLLTMPFVFDDWFNALGLSRPELLDFIPLDPITSYFYPDGTAFKSYSQRDKLMQAVSAATAENPQQLDKYLNRCASTYAIAAEVFLFHSLHEWSTYRSRAFLKSLPRLPFIRSLTTLDALNRHAFTDPRLVQLFNRYATYNGSSPYRTPGTMSLIPHVEYNLGACGVAGGIAEIPRAMQQAAEAHGVSFHFNTPVEQILLEDGRVRGIETGGEKLEYDAVVSNADILTSYEKLLGMPEHKAARRYRRLEPSSSGIVYYLGLRESFPELTLHNIFFSPDYRTEFQAIFEEGRVVREPTIYINITSKLTPGDARRGGENWFILINAPAARDQDWPAVAAETRTRVIDRLSTRLGRDIHSLIECSGTLTPPEIEAETGSTFGSLYGIASNSISAAFSRHPNRSHDIPGLYFAGGSAHPGGGMPLALLSGRLAAELLQRYEGMP